MVTNDELIEKLDKEIIKAGSLRKWASKHGLAADIVSKSRVARAVYPRVASALGYERTTHIWKLKGKKDS